MFGSIHRHRHAFVFKLNRSSDSCTQVLLRISHNLPLRCETPGPFVRLNDACNRPQEMKNTAIQAQRPYWLGAPLRPGCVCFFCFFLNFVRGVLTICEIPIFFFFFPSFYPPPPLLLGLIAFQMESYISSAPLLLSDGWIRGDQKGGDRGRVSAAFSFFFILSTFCQCAVPSNCMTCPGFSLPL